MTRKAKTVVLLGLGSIVVLGSLLFIYLHNVSKRPPNDSVTIHITTAGIVLDGKSVSLRSLGAELQRLKQDDTAIEVSAPTNADGHIGDVGVILHLLDVLDAIEKAGIAQVKIIPKLPRSPTPKQLPIS